jgi:type I restriction enzyme M protein
VSASVVLLERRKKPLARASESTDYVFFAGNIESVGWRAGDKKAVPVYLCDQMSGDLILDDTNEPILDADFAPIVNEFLRSPAVDYFPWTIDDRNTPSGPQTQGIDITDVARLHDLSLDPKRHSGKYLETKHEIEKLKHFRLGDVLDIVSTARPTIISRNTYQYVEIEFVGSGEYDYTELKGWQLPSRAKLTATSGDIFIPHIWGCAGKWFIAAGDCENLIVTNGCTRLRLKTGQDEILPDLLVGLCSEAFCVQMRALATGSDGLAEIVDDDLLSIVLPKILDEAERERVQKQVGPLLTGEARFGKFAKTIIDNAEKFPIPPPRKSHCALI